MTAITAELRCPVPRCQAGNAVRATACARCGTPLTHYARMQTYPSSLFNRGLSAARDGRLGEARDCFAVVADWCHHDLEAHSALALASFQLGDRDSARRHWELVLARRANEPLATWGLAQLDAAEASSPTAAGTSRSGTKRRTSRKQRRRR